MFTSFWQSGHCIFKTSVQFKTGHLYCFPTMMPLAQISRPHFTHLSKFKHVLVFAQWQHKAHVMLGLNIFGFQATNCVCVLHVITVCLKNTTKANNLAKHAYCNGRFCNILVFVASSCYLNMAPTFFR